MLLVEAYLDVTENNQGIPVATEVAQIIRDRIKEVTGLNASAGISYCKFLAKMASDRNKPNGQAVITPARGPQFVAELPVKKFHGVGPATAAKMERLGILTGAVRLALAMRLDRTVIDATRDAVIPVAGFAEMPAQELGRSRP